MLLRALEAAHARGELGSGPVEHCRKRIESLADYDGQATHVPGGSRFVAAPSRAFKTSVRRSDI